MALFRFDGCQQLAPTAALFCARRGSVLLGTVGGQSGCSWGGCLDYVLTRMHALPCWCPCRRALMRARRQMR